MKSDIIDMNSIYTFCLIYARKQTIFSKFFCEVPVVTFYNTDAGPWKETVELYMGRNIVQPSWTV